MLWFAIISTVLNHLKMKVRPYSALRCIPQYAASTTAPSVDEASRWLQQLQPTRITPFVTFDDVAYISAFACPQTLETQKGTRRK